MLTEDLNEVGFIGNSTELKELKLHFYFNICKLHKKMQTRQEYEATAVKDQQIFSLKATE